jgi:hypothetical protein
MGLFSKKFRDWTPEHAANFTFLEPGEQAQCIVMGMQGAATGSKGRGIGGLLVTSAVQAVSNDRNVKGDRDSIAQRIPSSNGSIYLTVTDRRICFVDAAHRVMIEMPRDCVISATGKGNRIVLHFNDESSYTFQAGYVEEVALLAAAIGCELAV